MSKKNDKSDSNKKRNNIQNSKNKNEPIEINESNIESDTGDLKDDNISNKKVSRKFFISKLAKTAIVTSGYTVISMITNTTKAYACEGCTSSCTSGCEQCNSSCDGCHGCTSCIGDCTSSTGSGCSDSCTSSGTGCSSSCTGNTGPTPEEEEAVAAAAAAASVPGVSEEAAQAAGSTAAAAVAAGASAEDAAASAAAAFTGSQTNGSNCSTGETDPVRLAIGTFIFNETDIDIKYIEKSISIARRYASDVFSVHSMGKGWAFNYDTRIVMGLKPNAVEIADNIEALTDEAWNKYNNALNLYNNAVSLTNNALNKANTFISKADSAVSKAQDAVSKANISGNSSLIANADNILNEANALKASATTNKTAVENTQDQLNDLNTSLEETKTKCEELDEIVTQLRKEADYVLANQEKNRYVYNESDPEKFVITGNGTLNLIDEIGTPHLYTLNTPPDYETMASYADGSKNYYPSGVTATPQLPTDDKLELLADGSYVVTKKDKSIYRYNFHGQLESITDNNGNRILFDYQNHALNGIVDDFGRVTTIQQHNGKITKITDPKGREFKYTYDDEERLTSVTDAVGDAIVYGYSANLLTEIVKPDGSKRSYYYAEQNGRTVVTHDTDEEGDTEYIRYYPEENYTEHESTAGIIEKHYYNERNLTTKIEYADGSYVTMAYDENNNMIKRVDELGNEYQYKYDDRRNVTEAIDPYGNSEKWTYNFYNKVTLYTDKSGRKTVYEYDNNANLAKVIYPDNSQINYTYRPGRIFLLKAIELLIIHFQVIM